jgi:hypothetical protein
VEDLNIKVMLEVIEGAGRAGRRLYDDHSGVLIQYVPLTTKRIRVSFPAAVPFWPSGW